MCQGIARCILIVFNILFLIFGVLCLAIGIWVRVDKNNLISLLRISSNTVDLKSYDVPSLLESGAYILIAVGAIVFVISIFGFCGAIRKSRCCLLTYGVLVGVVLVIQVAAGIAVAVFKSQFDSYANEFLNKTMPLKYDGPYKQDDITSLALDAMQASQQCCGVNGPEDFMNWNKWNTTWKVSQTAVIPFTCCKSTKMGSFPDNIADYISGLSNGDCPVNKAESYTTGCYDKLKDLVQTYYVAVLGVALGVAAVELILIIIACCIAKENKDEIV